MVHITKLTIKGFKSFPQKQATITLEKGLNVITGPNGSGKSNIIDAIRFAMGENSAKALRSSSLTGLIYDPGTGPAQSARVSVTFGNEDRTLAVEDDRVTIVRELKPNGDNSYYINGRKIARSNLTELLGAAHIMPEGINVVPQGAIGRLGELHPNERRQAIESAIGLKHFDEKKAEAMDRLREADNQLAVSFAKLDERRTAIERLELERNDALRYRQVDYEIRRLRKAILNRKIGDMDHQIEVAEKRVAELTAQQEEARMRILELQASLKSVEEERDVYYSTKVSVPNRQLIDLGLDIGRIDTKIAELEDKKRSYESDLSTLKDSARQLEGMLKSIDQEAAGVGAEVATLQEKLRVLDEEGRQEAERKKGLLQRKGKLERELQRTVVRDLRLSGEADRLGARISETVARVNALSGELRQMLAARDELIRKHNEVKGIVESMKQQLSVVAADIDALKKQLKEAAEGAEACQRQQDKLAAEVKAAERILADATQTIVKYESGKEAAEKYFVDELNTRKVEELAESGVVDGFRGRLADKLRYKDELAAAVKAAGQEWLSAMLVDDMQGLLQLAALSKRLRSARIRILPLSELRNTPVTKVPYGEGVMGRLSDFIESQGGCEPAVDFVFGNTVLCSSAKSAYLLSKRGFRCVTLQGDIFESGGRALETGKVSQLTLKQLGISDPEELKFVEESLKAFRISIERQKKGLERLAQNREAFEKEKFKAALKLENAESRLRTLVPLVRRYGRLERLSARRILEQEAVAAKLRRKMDAVNDALPRLRRRWAKMAERRAELGLLELTMKDNELEDQLNSISQSEEERARNVLAVNADLSTLQARLNGELTPKATQIREALAKSLSRIREAEENLPTIGKQLSVLASDRKAMAEKEAKIRQESEQSLPKLRELERVSKEIRERVAGIEQRILKLEKEKIRTEGTVQGLKGEKEASLRAVGELAVEEEVEYVGETDVLLNLYLQEQAALKDSVNLLADQSYKEAFTSYREASKRRNELEKDRNAIVRFIEEVESEKKSTFMAAYEKIDRELRSIFAKMTDGAAWMELENPADPFSGGIFLMAQFPTKPPRESSSVSGGEKAAVAVSFLLAFQAAYPSPFYLLDEIDSPLDALNAQRLGSLLSEWSSKSQILVVTLKEAVVAEAYNLLGVYAAHGASNVVRFRPKAEVTVNV